MSREARAHNEQRALQTSLFGAVFFIVLAVGFALLTQSDAILFDGIISLIAFSTILLTLKVARLAERPDDDLFHFGYTSLEPTLNLFKSLITIVTCLFAAVAAFKRLMAGGNPAEYGLAVVYGAVATAGCFGFAAWMAHASRQHRSDLVRVDIKNWIVDGLISAAVLLGFTGAWALTQFDMAHYAPLVDPILLIVLVLAALPIPVKIMLDSLREVIAMAPPEPVVNEIEQRLMATLTEIQYDRVELRVNKRGRNTYLLVHVIVADDFAVNTIAELDLIRSHSTRALKAWNPEIVMDMLFVKDPIWAD